MKSRPFVLSITGSDSMGSTGIQADIKTISALGGQAVTAVTTITIQDSSGIHSAHSLTAELVVGQVRAIIADVHPQAIKVGWMNDAEAIRLVADEAMGCTRLVCDPGILSSDGHRLVSDDAINAFRRYLLPHATLLMMKCNEAELLLDTRIDTNAHMLQAAQALCQMGAQWVLLRGGQIDEGCLTALLYGPDYQQYFSSYNIEGWQKHGVGGALAAAITTRLSYGDSMTEAIQQAHQYIHSQVVYSVPEVTQTLRSADLYNQLLSLLAQHHQQTHDVSTYAQHLCISPRYLTNITRREVGKSPKEVIDGYLIEQAKQMLTTSRLTIQEIALQLGFSSQAMFCRFFAQRTGCTPKEFRHH